MQTLKIDEKRARELYPTAAPEFKAMLEDSFSKEFFSQKITDRVKTYEDACKVKGVDPVDHLPYYADNAFESAINATAKLWLIAEVLNEGWQPDLSNRNQVKYYPYFEQKSGFGLSYDVYGFWDADTICGVRLAFKSAELAEYAGKQFIDLYSEAFLMQ